MPVMSTITSSRIATGGIQIARPGQMVFTRAGFGGSDGTWKVPQGVYKISGVMITGGRGGNAAASATIGGSGGQGGHLLYFNDFSVSPGETIILRISSGGSGGINTGGAGQEPGETWIMRSDNTYPNGSGPRILFGGSASLSGNYREVFLIQNNVARPTTVNAFGAGGSGGPGFSGTVLSANVRDHVGGRGGIGGGAAAASGENGGGGGGASGSGSIPIGAGGGGTGFIVHGTNGTAGTVGTVESSRIGNAGNGGGTSPATGTASSGTGGFPGGGGGGGGTARVNGEPGGDGVIRIIWGSGRSYPSNSQDV